MTFRRGQKVACIRDDWFHPLLHLVPNRPVAKQTYTVRDIVCYGAGRPCGLRLEGLVNPICNVYKAEPSFNAEFFRPLVERKNDGEAFVAQLKKIAMPVMNKELCGNG